MFDEISGMRLHGVWILKSFIFSREYIYLHLVRNVYDLNLIPTIFIFRECDTIDLRKVFIDRSTCIFNKYIDIYNFIVTISPNNNLKQIMFKIFVVFLLFKVVDRIEVILIWLIVQVNFTEYSSWLVSIFIYC